MSKCEIHPTAIVEDGAKLGEDVRIGPYCLVGRDASLGDGCQLLSHVVVAGRTTIGPRARTDGKSRLASSRGGMQEIAEPMWLAA